MQQTRRRSRRSGIVLIDTWWNVNRIGVVPISAKDVGFNRYMVECECQCIEKSVGKWVSFNRYMVECE